MKIKFLCGCETGEVVDRVNLETMDSVIEDEEGMLICAIHGERRYGWRSIPRSENHVGIKRHYWGLTPKEVEGRILFKDPFPKPLPLNVKFATEDLRDKRDPQTIGEACLRLVEIRGQSKNEIRQEYPNIGSHFRNT